VDAPADAQAVVAVAAAAGVGARLTDKHFSITRGTRGCLFVLHQVLDQQQRVPLADRQRWVRLFDTLLRTD
jgi:hypothetical protein